MMIRDTTTALAGFHPAVGDWFRETLGEPTRVQADAWPAIHAGQNTLIAAPTGSGKTLAAFLTCIDRLVADSVNHRLETGTRVLYVSPLKALSNDIHCNLEIPLAGIAERLEQDGVLYRPITAAVRTGDTTPGERDKMRRKPPHILVTTPESLFILLTSDSGRGMLSGVETVIVDEIHAMAGSKRGAHLSLSLARLDALRNKPPVRIGLSATQKPIETMARFLCNERPCRIVDTGYQRERDLDIEVPEAPLSAIMSNEVWEEIYDRLANLVATHSTTLIFVNTRRLSERVTRHLADRLGEDAVMAHHGSLAKEHRLEAEQRLKAGTLKAMVATASLELGIDIGDVDLVCQLGSPRSIAGFLQRVGRSGHAVNAIPKGRLFPLSRDDLVECSALMRAVRADELDRIVPPDKPLDVLAQQIVAEVACREWDEAALYECFRSAWSYRDLSREEFGDVSAMLAEGFATRRGRRSAYLHRDVVNGKLRARRAARLNALTNAGTIPDQFDYEVYLRPQDLRIGTLNEDFAFESLPGDIFQLGNTSYRILKVETGRVYVEDAKGQPPNIPFWFGEAPGRSDELSAAVSDLRRSLGSVLDDGDDPVQWLKHECGLAQPAARQLAEYLAAARAALGELPTQDRIVLERFFDETGDLHLVVHSTFGSRINRALGLSLRKRFCRKFNFELQASALEDSVVLSLGPTHSFPLEEVMGYLRSDTVREVLIQAVLNAPMFPTRWRWAASVALAVRRMNGGQRRPPQFQRSDAEDLIAVVFPDQLACQENIAGPREIPDHPLVNQSMTDCLTEVMDLAGLERLLKRVEAGTVEVVCRDLVHPSPLAEEIINARPYAFLDGGAAEERRTNAVRTQPHVSVSEAAKFARLDPEVIDEVCAEVWIEARDCDELHDGLMIAGFITGDEMQRESAWPTWLNDLATAGRAVQLRAADRGSLLWVARERLHEALAVWGSQTVDHPEPLDECDDRETALVAMIRSRLEVLGPISAERLAGQAGIGREDIEQALVRLETEGTALRGRFREGEGEQWCDRRILARIHRRCLNQRRARFKPVDAASFMRFLLRWHGLDQRDLRGRAAMTRLLGRLEGVSMPAGVIEKEILARRLDTYQPDWIDDLCRSGEFTWLRLKRPDPGSQPGRVVAQTPIALVPRSGLKYWIAESEARGVEEHEGVRFSSEARRALDALREAGALFFEELRAETGLLESRLENALAELVAGGAINADAFHGIRFLTRSQRDRARSRRHAQRGLAVTTVRDAGRWALIRRDREAVDPWERAEYVARALLRRYGVLFRALLDRDPVLPPWRDLLYVLRRMEAREEIHGGRFVEGFSGEQFALPDAAALLRNSREPGSSEPVVISACDPLNLTGVVLPGERVPAAPGNRLALADGELAAALVADEMRAGPGGKLDWALRQTLIRDPANVLPRHPPAGRRPPVW